MNKYKQQLLDRLGLLADQALEALDPELSCGPFDGYPHGAYYMAGRADALAEAFELVARESYTAKLQGEWRL